MQIYSIHKSKNLAVRLCGYSYTALYNVHCALNAVQCTLYNIHRTLCTE